MQNYRHTYSEECEYIFFQSSIYNFEPNFELSKCNELPATKNRTADLVTGKKYLSVMQ